MKVLNVNQIGDCELYYMMTAGNAGRVSFGKKLSKDIPAHLSFVVEYAPNKFLPMDETEEEDWLSDKWIYARNSQCATLNLQSCNKTKTMTVYNLLFTGVYDPQTLSKVGDVDLYLTTREFEFIKANGVFFAGGKLSNGDYVGFIVLPRTAYWGIGDVFYSGATGAKVKESTARGSRKRYSFSTLLKEVIKG